MAQQTDWLPASRNAQLEMALNWENLLVQKGSSWEIPQQAITK